MSQKVVARKGQDPRVLTVSEIRTRVEELAEELACRLRPARKEDRTDQIEAYPLDTRAFIEAMSAHMVPN